MQTRRIPLSNQDKSVSSARTFLVVVLFYGGYVAAGLGLDGGVAGGFAGGAVGAALGRWLAVNLMH